MVEGNKLSRMRAKMRGRSEETPRDRSRSHVYTGNHAHPGSQTLSSTSRPTFHVYKVSGRALRAAYKTSEPNLDDTLTLLDHNPRLTSCLTFPHSKMIFCSELLEVTIYFHSWCIHLISIFVGEETERAPVWVMRQAGRYLPGTSQPSLYAFSFS